MQLITLIITKLKRISATGLTSKKFQQENFSKQMLYRYLMKDYQSRRICPWALSIRKLWAKNSYPDCTENTLTRKTNFGGFAPLVPDSCMITGLFINPLINCFLKLEVVFQHMVVFQHIFLLFYTTYLLRIFFLRGKIPTRTHRNVFEK